MKLITLNENIYWIKTKTVKDIAYTFLRFQEFYESKKYKGKIFKKKDFLKWYEKSNKTKYLDDYEGFNLPSWVIKVFEHGIFNPLDKSEKKLLKLLQNKIEPYYVIGTKENDKNTLNHELAHALYHLNADYRQEVNRILKSCKSKNFPKFKKKLANFLGYSNNVLIDEIHAYLLFESDYLKDELKITLDKSLIKAQAKLKNLFISKYNFSIPVKNNK